ncbi:flagellar biosynthetic protein FliR [Hahella sp. NBU794]|uniref:flagellar biosynthetic protein FliR n=1 Tax=Hahella sp. NBU794 TaxID=3422590 RepID=UPI003D6E41F2
MHFTIDLSWAWAWWLLSIRLALVVMASPFDMFGRLPGRIRFFLVFALALLMVRFSPTAGAQLPSSIVEMALACANELVLGLAMALGLHAAFTVFQIAGRLIDFQSGFGAANIMNPATNSAEPLMGTILLFFATFVFFSMDAHHMVIKGLAYSVAQVPPGSGLARMDFNGAMKQVGLMFSFAMVLAAPVLAVLFLLDVGVAVMARTMPQMNVYFLFLPLKVALGIGVTALSLKYLTPLIGEVFISIFRYWSGMLTVI